MQQLKMLMPCDRPQYDPDQSIALEYVKQSEPAAIYVMYC